MAIANPIRICDMQSGLSLSLRNVSSMVVILTATSMVTGLGTITMAAHEILRQVWIISIQAFMALDICAQSLVASYLGQVRSTQRCTGEAALSLLTCAAAVTVRMQMYKIYVKNILHSISIALLSLLLGWKSSVYSYMTRQDYCLDVLSM